MSRSAGILGVITARGGSKGVPRKNVRPLGGRPLIAWTIAAARASNSLDRVILSTDDEEIAAVGREYGAEVPFMRPAELATDTSHHPEVMIHAVRFMAEENDEIFDTVVLLQPTVPFRRGRHIDAAIAAWVESGAETLIALKPQDYPPWWMFRLDSGRIRPAVEYRPGVNVFNMERQEFPPVYRPNGAVYVTGTDALVSNRRLVNPEDCAYYVMEETDSMDIDTETDFATAEALLASGRVAGPEEQ